LFRKDWGSKIRLSIGKPIGDPMKARALSALVLVMSSSMTGLHQPTEVSAQDAQQAVLITGASSGIGRVMAEYLADRGFFVYAGARSAEDLAELDQIDNIQSIRLDVTVQSEIDAAVETVRNADRGLFGLVNNAGVLITGPLIELGEDDIAFQMDVNVFGPYRVTKAFAPMIIESEGRIATTGSLNGFVSGAFSGAYAMTKHAMEAYTDALAGEMAGFGVDVTVIEPGGFNSDILGSLRAWAEQSSLDAESSRYGDVVTRILATSPDRSSLPEPIPVAEAAYHFFASDQPQPRYLVPGNQRESALTSRAVLTRLVEINTGQPYPLDRDELVQMLDELLAEAGSDTGRR